MLLCLCICGELNVSVLGLFSIKFLTIFNFFSEQIRFCLFMMGILNKKHKLPKIGFLQCHSSAFFFTLNDPLWIQG